MKSYKTIAAACITALLALTGAPSKACDKIAGLPDVNCDGQIRISVVGDSLVYGRGDSVNGNQGGYVARIAKSLPLFTFVNLGVPGWETRPLIRKIDLSVNKNQGPKFKAGVITADIIIIDIGRNDFFREMRASATLRNIRRARTLLEEGILARTGSQPLVIVAALMIPNRTTQAKWIRDLNKALIAENTAAAPTDLRFDKVSQLLISEDKIHPTSAGYVALAKVLRNYLRVTLPKKFVTTSPTATPTPSPTPELTAEPPPGPAFERP